MLQIAEEKQKPNVYFFDYKELEKNNVGFKYVKDLQKAIYMNIAIFLVAALVCAGITFLLSGMGWMKWLSIIPWVILAIVPIVDLFGFSFENSRTKNMEDIVFVEDNGTMWSLFFYDPEFCPIPRYIAAKAKDPDSEATRNLKAICEDYVLTTLKDAQKRKVTLGILDDPNYKYAFNRRAGIIRLDKLKFQREDDYSWFFTYEDKDTITKTICWIKGYPGFKEKYEELGEVAVNAFPFPWLNRPNEAINEEE